MNLRNVLRTYSLLRQLSDDESALLATLRAMSDSERELLVESLQPDKGAGKKKAAAKKSAGKSPRASNMAATLGKNLAQQRKPMCATCGSTDPNDGDHGTGEGQHEFSTDVGGRLQKLMSNEDRCTFEIDGKVCKGLAGDAIHDATMGYGGYHEFVGGEAAQTASGD